jgi:nitrate reductase delta subunit
MVDLQTMYSQHGLAPITGELPDYLPMLCEFLSLLPDEGARAMVGDLAVILGLLRLRLEERRSAYAAIPAALLELAAVPVDEAELRAVVQEESVAPPSFDQLDQQWSEAEVTFGAGDAAKGCGDAADDGLVQLRRAKA